MIKLPVRRYGPFWVATTLVFVIAATGNYANYVSYKKKHSATSSTVQVWYSNVDKVPRLSSTASAACLALPMCLPPFARLLCFQESICILPACFVQQSGCQCISSFRCGVCMGPVLGLWTPQHRVVRQARGWVAHAPHTTEMPCRLGTQPFCSMAMLGLWVLCCMLACAGGSSPKSAWRKSGAYTVGTHDLALIPLA